MNASTDDKLPTEADFDADLPGTTRMPYAAGGVQFTKDKLGFWKSNKTGTKRTGRQMAALYAKLHRDPTYRCACSWVGGDPDVRTVRGRIKRTCPACWHHDRKRVEVVVDEGAPT